MGKPSGFLEYERKTGINREESVRTRDFREFHQTLPAREQREQAARCMACGVPFCQYGDMISGMASGCPLHNLVPEFNDLVYRDSMEQAYLRLQKTNCFPEFTSRVCPALCEAACTCNVHTEPVCTKENERAIIEYAYDHGLVIPRPPRVRTGKKVAVIGSGPAGLAAAYYLNRRGHQVTVFERKDRIGGLLMYGIPNMKLDKSVILRRQKILEAEGIEFRTGTEVTEANAKEIRKEYDRVLLACGASRPRDILAKGREASGIWFAVDFLSQVTKELLDSDFQKAPYEKLEGKQVVVIGGGDTGNDCVGTAIRLKAKSVVQLEMMPCPPKTRTPANPWPEWPRVLKTDYGQQEAIWKFGQDPRIYQTTVEEFIQNEKGELCKLKLVKLEPKKDEKTGRMNMVPVKGSSQIIPADVVLIAAGFVGAQDEIVQAFQVEKTARGTVSDRNYETSVPGVFAAGDMRRGQSLVVWAIREGTEAAKAVDASLMGYTNLV